jgi:site-specific DNA recombinase
MSNRAILYLRSSKDRSDVSIDAQRRALHELAGQRNLVIVDEYTDAVESGKDDDRPAFQRMLHALKQPHRAWDVVLVLDTSRIARRILLAEFFAHECEKRGVSIVYRNVPDADPATSMLLKAVLQAMDQWHSMTSKAKGLAGMAENVRQGWRAGGRAPRGYKLDYTATGAVRDGTPVLKSRLVLDDSVADQVRDYLKLRAEGVSRGVAIARLQLPWQASSTHSMDWQALTYAGHTVWGMHAERKGGSTPEDGEKRRPRNQWVVQRNTHPALITDEEAEAILVQQERALQGRRARASPLLLTGLLEAPDGTAWWADGEGNYRLGKGKRIGSARLDGFVLDLVREHLLSDEAVEHVRQAMNSWTRKEPVDGRALVGLEKRISTLTTQIGRTVDLAAGLADPAPVLRRVADLELARTQLVDELAKMRQQRELQVHATAVDDKQVRALLRRLFDELCELPPDEEAQRTRARQALSEVLERIVLDPSNLSVQPHYAVKTGVILASPRGFEPLLQP